MEYCPKCHEPIKDGDTCYQIRYGHWEETDAQDPGEFGAEEDVAYYHAGCLPDEVVLKGEH